MNACRDHVEILSISLFCANGFYPFTSLLRSRVHVAIFVFSFSPFSQLLPEAVYKSGRRLHPPATLYRTDERERHEGRDGGRKGEGYGSGARGQGGYAWSRCRIRCNEVTSMHCGIPWLESRTRVMVSSLFFSRFIRLLISPARSPLRFPCYRLHRLILGVRM